MDKTKTCQYCPDRYPGCHDICPEYKERTARNNELKKRIYEQKKLDQGVTEILLGKKRH